jgi:hypothetical protein
MDRRSFLGACLAAAAAPAIVRAASLMPGRGIIVPQYLVNTAGPFVYDGVFREFTHKNAFFLQEIFVGGQRFPLDGSVVVPAGSSLQLSVGDETVGLSIDNMKLCHWQRIGKQKGFGYSGYEDDQSQPWTHMTVLQA